MAKKKKNKRYGVSYQGSKNGIAKWVLEHLPSNSTFVDLFAGGCAITHCAMESGKYDRFIANDLADALDVFWNAIHGEYRDETRWISREDFFGLKDSDPYVALCWSFGNNRKGYLYSKEVEPWKRALHYARVFGDTSKLAEFGITSDGSRADIRAHKEEYTELYIRWWLSQQGYTPAELDALIANVKEDIAKDEEELRNYLLEALHKSGLTQAEVQRRLGTQMSQHYFGRSQWAFPTQEYYEQMQTFMDLPTDYTELVGLYRLRQSLQSLESLESLGRLERLQSLQSLESLGRLERLQSLQSLESLERLTVTHLDYRDLDIPSGALVYADPPYRNTTAEGYANGGEFDYEAFDRWLAEVNHPVIVSEYTCPAGCVQIAAKQKAVTMCSGSAKKAQEGLFIQERYLDWYYEQMCNVDCTTDKEVTHDL